MSGRCVTTPKASGHLPDDDVRGDCKRPACAEGGERVDRIDPTDVPPPSAPCRSVRCEERGPVEALAPGATCGEHGTCTSDDACVTITRIALGSRHGCALATTGIVSCFGWDSSGQLSGKPSTRLTSSAERVSFVKGVVDLAVNDNQSCALLQDGTVLCWGGTGDAALQSKLKKGGPVITPIAGIERATLLGAAGRHTCALHSDGVLSCWGDASPKPVLIARPRRATRSLVVGPNGVCALLDDATVQCFHTRWEESPSGRSLMPEAEAMKDVASLALGSSHACAVTTDGALSCWGAGNDGEVDPDRKLGDERWVPPTRIQGLGAVASVAVPLRQTCALLVDGQTACWGSPYHGEGRGRLRVLPWKHPATALAMSYWFGCALGVSSKVLCMGDTAFGSSSTRPYDPAARAWAIRF